MIIFYVVIKLIWVFCMIVVVGIGFINFKFVMVKLSLYLLFNINYC